MPDAASPAKILVVDDEDVIRGVISQVLGEDGFEVTEAGSAEEALAVFRRQPHPLVITDIVMSRMSGIELLHELRTLDPEVLVVVMTSHASLETATSALRCGAYDYLTKPFEDLNSISAVARRALERRRMAEDNKLLMDQLKKNAEELRDLNHALQDLAMRDGLTGLHNHRYFTDALEREISRADRHGRQFSLIFADVDHFKRYNDLHGHLAGDELLRSLAQLLLAQRRGYTVVARYGGEEFVLLLAEADKAAARQVAEIIRSRVEQHDFPGGHTQPLGRVTLSLGVATCPQDGTDAKTLIGAADRALYEAKRSGRNAVRG